ncbi:hypothetical protein DOY81_009869 [Sarcophaga bullata]|nr:hypothetical protein DOY81_009869 [Sarcophaga bullata]
MHWKFVLIFLSIYISNVKTARILSIFGMPIPSQYGFIEPLLKELAARGHHITSINNYPQEQPLENFRDVVVKENKHLFDDFQNFTMDNIDTNYYEVIDGIYNRTYQMCLNVQNNAEVRQIFDNEHFDLIILEIYFSESFTGLAEHLKAPLVAVSTMCIQTSIDVLVGNVSPLSYVPNWILPLQQMNFWQRLLNILLHLVEWMDYYFKYLPVQKQIYDRYFPHNKMSFEEARKNFSLILLNDHFSLTMPRPLVPNMIEVAGLNIKNPADPLTPLLKTILDKAFAGAILISFDISIDHQQLQIFLQQFKSMKELILWRTPQLFNHISLPSNVLVSSNFSVSSILSHPNLKLYVTHGSFLSIIESVYYGLPILGITTYEKNDDFMDYIKKVGNGLTLKLQAITNRSLNKAFTELLHTPYFANHAKTLSIRFRDQQNTPMEKAVYWIEYVLRHKGATHLRNLGQNLTWWQFYNLDVYVALVCMFALVIFLAFFVLKVLMNLTERIVHIQSIKINKIKRI